MIEFLFTRWLAWAKSARLSEKISEAEGMAQIVAP
jgi:hypothetical protein